MPKPRTPTTVTLRAVSGGIAIGGNNSGVLITAVKSGLKPPHPLIDWPALSGLIIGILGLVIATLAWLLPRTP
jgi:amino acid transporter